MNYEIKQGITECMPTIVNDIMVKLQPSSNAIKQDIKMSFAEIMKDQTAETQKVIIKQAINEDKKEQDKLEQRKRNVMIFNAKEPATNESDAAKMSQRFTIL